MKWLWLALIVVLFSCKKKDEVSPDVNINNKELLSTNYQIPSELQLSITATDNEGLQGISVEIRNQNNITVAGPASISLDGQKSHTWGAVLEVTDRYIPSGEYYIAAIARDGSNSSSDFYDISLSEVPLISQRIDVISPFGNMSRIDTGYYDTSLEEALITDRIDFAAFDPRQQTIWASGDPEMGIRIYDAGWNLQNTLPTLTGGEGPYFYQVLPQSIDGRFYTATFDHAVKAYDHLGNIARVYDGPPSTRGRAVAVSDDKVLGAFASFNEDLWFVTSFFRQSASEIETATAPFAIDQLFPETDNTFIVLGHTEDQMVWARFYVAENAFDVISETSISEEVEYALYEDGKALVIYNSTLHYSNNLQSFFPLLSASNNNFLAWDEAQNFALFNNSNILEINGGTFPFVNQSIANIPLLSTPKQAMVIYNK